MDNYYNKYIKYKTKYLYTQTGGNNGILQYKSIFKKLIFPQNNIIDTVYNYNRIFFIFYILFKYVFQIHKNHKQIFFKLIDDLPNDFKNNFKNKYDEFYNTFFIQQNIYFHTYFNNIIKYFLPLPFHLLDHFPFLTYRNNVQNIFKNDNIDFLYKKHMLDTFTHKKYTRPKNIDTIQNELDLHIPIQFFDLSLFDSQFKFLIATKNTLYITDNKLISLYSRDIQYNNLNKFINKYKKGFPFEHLFPIWTKHTQTIDIKDAFYISVIKQFKHSDIFNFFKPISFNTNKYKFLFHNLNIHNIPHNTLLNTPTFFYFIPSSKSKYLPPKDEKQIQCITFKIHTDITNIIDLTDNIIVNNSFTQDIINKDKHKWISYDPLKVMDFFNTGSIPTKNDTMFKCLTTKNNTLDRIYCDVKDTQYYSGRRKLQEILFKTRKYDISQIYCYDFFPHKNKLVFNKQLHIYHPPNSKDLCYTRDMDKIILSHLQYNGFFFTDFLDATDGGEIYLSLPNKFIQIHNTSNISCYNH